MAKTLPQLVFVTFVTSGIALVLSIVALGTEQWITAGVTVRSGAITTLNNRVSYGFFTGSYTRTVSSESNYQLIITCDFGENKCAMLCGTSTLRNEYFQYLFSGQAVGQEGYQQCSTRSTRAARSFNVSVVSIAEPRADGDDAPDGFMNCGIWISTIVFLGLSIVFGLASTVLSIINTVANPVETIFSITGLFAYNCVACVCSTISVILFGVHFGMVLKDNAAIFDTIALIGDSEGQGALGYSFWLLVPVVLGYAASAIILAVRQYMINKEPDTIVNLEDKNDNTIILF